VTRIRRRRFRRAPAPSNLWLSFWHPTWGELHVRRSLRDLSVEGLSFWTDPWEDLVFSGLPLPVLEVLSDRDPPVVWPRA
jgi:hypothetical protein